MEATPQVRRLDQTTLSRLAKIRGELVLSFYLDLQPDTFATPRARATEVRSLVHSANMKLDEIEDSQVRVQLNKELEAIEAFLEAGGLTSPTSPSIAIFRSEPLDLFEVVEIPQKVEPQVEIGEAPFIAPIATNVPSSHLVLLVNRKTARVMSADAHGVKELEEVYDDVRGQHDQGGWSQARFQRSVEKEVRDHLKDSADVLFEIFKGGGYTSLIVGALEELRPQVEDSLHPYLKQRMSEYIDIDIEHASISDIEEAVSKVLAHREAEAKDALLERLQQGGSNGLATSRLSGVLEAINTKRIEALLLSERLEPMPGVRCASCDYLGRQGKECPVDGTALDSLDDLTESMLHLTILTGGIVERVPDGSLPDDSKVAAVLRF